MDSGEFSSMMFAKAARDGIPLSVTFELTKRCNFGCSMCYIHDGKCGNEKDGLETDDWIELADKAAEIGTLYILLTGGEPLMRKDFCELYSRLHEKGFILSLNTNGSLFDDNSIAVLAENIPESVNVSLYGMSEETYRKVCSRGEAYPIVIENIIRLKSLGVNVRLNYLMTPNNICDAEKIFAFARENDIPLRADMYTFPPVRCEGQHSLNRFSPNEYARARMKYDLLRFDEKTLKSRSDIIGQLRKVKENCLDCGNGMLCRAGKCSCWITASGKMLLCGMMPSPEVDVLKNGFSASWNKIREERDKIRLDSKCAMCKYRYVCCSCPAVCEAEKSFCGDIRYCCDCTEEYVKLYTDIM